MDYDVFGNLDELCQNNLPDSVNYSLDLSPEDSFDLTLSQNVTKETNKIKKSKTSKKVVTRRSSRLSNEKEQDASPEEIPLSVNLKQTKSGKKQNSGRSKAAAAAAKGPSKEIPTKSNDNAISEILSQITTTVRRGRTRSGRRNCGSMQTVLQNFMSPTQTTNAQNVNRNVTRARRNAVAEKAARLGTIDFIDLITSPIVPVQGFVDLEIDEEQTADTNKNSEVADDRIDFENPEVILKVMWGEKIETLTLRKYQKFLHLFKKLAEQHNCPVDQVVCNLNDKFIKNDDTPASLDYKPYNFIYARATNILKDHMETVSKKRYDANNICLKVQSDKFKRPLQVEISKTETFKILYIKCAEELDVATSRIKLSFDGDELDQSETPAGLELEGGEAIDMRIL